MNRRWNSHVHVCYAGFGIRSFAHSLFALSLFAHLLKIAYCKERPGAICSRCSLLKSESLSSLFKKERCEWFALDSYFSYVFFTFFPLFMPKRELLPSLFAQSLFLKERLHSRRSLQTSDCERFALVALFHEWLLFRSFAHNKRANCSTNLWENSQPWCYVRGCSVNSYVMTIFRVTFFAFYQVTIAANCCCDVIMVASPAQEKRSKWTTYFGLKTTNIPFTLCVRINSILIKGLHSKVEVKHRVTSRPKSIIANNLIFSW